MCARTVHTPLLQQHTFVLHPGACDAQQDQVTASEKEKERRTTLERVNKMMFHETDSAKGFHSAALHCDVLAERAAQIELKQQVCISRSGLLTFCVSHASAASLGQYILVCSLHTNCIVVSCRQLSHIPVLQYCS